MTAIIDYDAGNIRSVENAFRRLGDHVEVTGDPARILSADRVILPGVGAFGDAMGRLRASGLEEVILQVVRQGIPFLGICLGLQLLFEESEESPGVRGLSVLKGKIRRLPEGGGRKIPQIGWNDLSLSGDGTLFRGTQAWSNAPYVYFVHSYYLEASDPSIVKATCDYGVTVHASVEQDRVFACQFHPEKSGDFGMQMLKNFSTL